AAHRALLVPEHVLDMCAHLRESHIGGHLRFKQSMAAHSGLHVAASISVNSPRGETLCLFILRSCQNTSRVGQQNRMTCAFVENFPAVTDRSPAAPLQEPFRRRSCHWRGPLQERETEQPRLSPWAATRQRAFPR